MNKKKTKKQIDNQNKYQISNIKYQATKTYDKSISQQQTK